jgi:hypothetical protein
MRLNDQGKISIAREYFFIGCDACPDFLELFHEDVLIYFSKFGIGFGRQSFFQNEERIQEELAFMCHDYSNNKYAKTQKWKRQIKQTRSLQPRNYFAKV